MSLGGNAQLFVHSESRCTCAVVLTSCLWWPEVDVVVVSAARSKKKKGGAAPGDKKVAGQAAAVLPKTEVKKADDVASEAHIPECVTMLCIISMNRSITVLSCVQRVTRELASLVCRTIFSKRCFPFVCAFVTWIKITYLLKTEKSGNKT